MKFSDAIEAGARLLNTSGPDFKPYMRNGGFFPYDVLVAAQAGLLGRLPTAEETREFYWDNPWAPFGSQLELWCRLTIFHDYRWADVIKKLRGHGA